MNNIYFAAIGSACFDEYFKAESWMDEGEKLIVSSMKKEAGGMVANAASVLAGYGAKVFYLDEMNGSSESEALKQSLSDFGLDTRFIETNETLPDARCLIILTPKERSVLVVDSGKKPRTLSADAQKMLEGAACIYSTMSEVRLIDNYSESIEKWRMGGAKLAFDVEPATFDSLDDYLFSAADILLFNRAGFEKAAAGKTFEQTAGVLLDKGAEIISVTLGAEGCRCWTRNDSFMLPGVKVKPVDTTGAGDTFNASFVYRLFCGDDPYHAAVFANAAAARSVTVPGPKGGVADEKTVRTFLAERILQDIN